MEANNFLADRDRVIKVLAAAMQYDGLGRYFQLDSYNLPNSSIITLQQSERFFIDILAPLHAAGAIFAETSDFGGVSIWCPPGFTWPEDSGPYLSTAMQDYGAVAEAAKQRCFGSSPYWYLFVIGRDPEHLGKSIAPRLTKPFIEMAKRGGVPVWLEATSEHSKKVYEKLGFRAVEELRVGQERCNEDGDLVDGGEGVRVWGMVANYD